MTGSGNGAKAGETPLHDWMTPRLEQLLAEAERAGFARDAAVAVVIDLIEGPAFNPGPGSEAG
jgi:hypothetical protein